MTKTARKLMHPRKERGFTMVELMITVLVLAILTTVGLPAYRSFVVSQRIKSASFDLIASLSMARSEAIKRNVSVDVTPTGGSWLNGWTLVLSGTATTLNNKQALGSGLSISCFSGSNPVTPCPTVTYNSSGRLTGASAPAIQITSNDASTAAGFAMRCISIDLSGRPNSKKASCP